MHCGQGLSRSCGITSYMDFQHLLEGNSNEERLAGILLALKFLETDGSLSLQDRCNIISHLISTVSPLFILRMVSTKTMLTNSSVQDIAVNLLVQSCQYPDVMKLFQHMSTDIYAVARVSENTSVLEFLAKVCEMGGSSECENIFRHALGVVSSTNPKNMLTIFNFLVEMTLHCKIIGLTAEESKTLRSLLMEGWGAGGSEENVRDTFVIATVVFLSRIHPSWTLEESVDGDGPDKSGRFAMVLCSIVCGEFRLLEHECVHMLDLMGCATNEQILATSGGNTPSGDTDIRPDKYNDTYILQRLQRVVRMSFVCYEIFDVILSLLVGEGATGVGWGDLPGEVMGVLQKEMSESIHLFYEFIAFSAKFNKEDTIHGSDALVTQTRVLLSSYLSRGMQSFSQWILEDESLHRPMISAVEQLFPTQTNIHPLPAACESLADLPLDLCKSVVDTVLRGQTSLIYPDAPKVIESLFRVCPTPTLPSGQGSATPAHMRIELVDASHADILITCLAAMTQISEIEEGPETASSLAKKMRFSCVCATGSLCSIACAVYREVESLTSPGATFSEGLCNGRSLNEWTAALVVASNAIELLCVLLQTRGATKGQDAVQQYGDTVRDTMIAEYIGLSVNEVRMLVTAAQECTEESFLPDFVNLVKSDDYGYWIDCNAQLLEVISDQFSTEILH